MPHDTTLISTIVMGLVLAFIFGIIANRFRMPPLVGYLVAGVVVGPYTPGFVADGALAQQLSEIGVILLMFGVGLHFSLKDLLSVRAIAIPGAIVQIGGATLLGLGVALLMGWSIGAGLMFGLALSVASTVVLLKALQDRHLVESERGRVAVGWLIVEDLVMVLALVLVPALAGLLGGGEAELHDPFISFVERALGNEVGLGGVLAITVVKLAAFVGFMLIVGRRIIPWALHHVAHTGSRELFRLAVLAIALGVAAGAAHLFGVSLALGAFFAGMILSESELSHRAANETLPLRDAFAVLFFVSVGMLFDPSVLITSPLPVLGTVLIIVVGKSILAYLIVVAFRRPVDMALTISASLAQIGEFSFILASLGVGLAIMPPEAQGLIIAGALISIVFNPVAFWAIERLRPMLEGQGGGDDAVAIEPDAPVLDAPPAAVPVALSGHAVLVGYGRVGRVIAEQLAAHNVPFVIVEDADTHAESARAAGIEVIAENGATIQALTLANVREAAQVLIAIPNAFEAGQAVEKSRKLNPGAAIIARGHSDEEEVYLRGLGADHVIIGEREIGLGMVEQLHLPSLPAPDASTAIPALAPRPDILEGEPRTDAKVTALMEDDLTLGPAPRPDIADADLSAFAQSDVSPEYYGTTDLALENADHVEADPTPGPDLTPGNDPTPDSDPAPELPGSTPGEVSEPTPPAEVPPSPVPDEDPVPPMPNPGPGPVEVPPLTPDPGTVPGQVPTGPAQPTAPPGPPPTVAADGKQD